MTPAQILLFLALTASLTGRAHCQEPGDEDEAAVSTETTGTTPLPKTEKPDTTDAVEYDEATEGSALPENTDITPPAEDERGLNPVIIIIPLVLVLVIICIVVALVMICRRWKSKATGPDPAQQDAYLDACEGEKVPMPMFEEDVPSVLELEMEDLEKWMVKDGGGGNINSEAV
ncbi:hypothetical protein ACEWY4_007395 [Coilia grayii]|uniref:Transmembrane protein 154 n=1 Tax=Coilia grayii TaxID=363190 RepID=A0ABD1KGB3_9TELE